MKKFFIFASFIAAVAMFASCNNKGDKPKARFDYAIDGLTVTFTNMSKDAEEYVWEFGDGTLFSKEANPVHEYAEAGTYTVKLTAKNKAGENSTEQAITLEEKAWEIKIDGNFSDWDEVPEELLAVAELSEDAVYEHLYKIKFCSDADYVYMYAEWDATEGVVGPFSLLIDADDDVTTGMNNYLFASPSGTEILIQGAPEEGFGDASIFTFTGATQEDWGWNDEGIVGAIEASEVKVGNGIKAFECAIMRAMMPATPKSFNIGVYTSDVDWTDETGVLPEQIIDGDGNTIKSEVLEVILN
ncbi:MAG: PKD domain-containing protein [Paludibacteraceae bacterium]|nr:PKD domain-containing protein [Paludibacteraceae bacterium]